MQDRKASGTRAGASAAVELSSDHLVLDEEIPGAAPATRVAPGDLIGEKYRVERLLGSGGMALVVEAKHRFTSTSVAIKFLHVASDPKIVERLLREAQIVAQMKSEHVARVLDAGLMPDGSPYCVMELLEGVDLARYLEDNGPLGIAEAANFMIQACEALAEAHGKGIVHRDIKPSNLFVTKGVDGQPLIKVIDFGIAKLRTAHQAGITQKIDLLGTPEYMSPEHLRATADVDARADIWALGVTLFELLTGQRPFEHESLIDLCGMIVASPPAQLPPSVPPGLRAVIMKCLEKDPAARFHKISALVTALAPFAPDETPSVNRILRVQPLSGPPARATTLAFERMQLQRAETLVIPTPLTLEPFSTPVPVVRRRPFLFPVLGALAVALVASVVWAGTRHPTVQAPVAMVAAAPPAPSASALVLSEPPHLPTAEPAAAAAPTAPPAAAAPRASTSAAPQRPAPKPTARTYEDLGF